MPFQYKSFKPRGKKHLMEHFLKPAVNLILVMLTYQQKKIVAELN